MTANLGKVQGTENRILMDSGDLRIAQKPDGRRIYAAMSKSGLDQLTQMWDLGDIAEGVPGSRLTTKTTADGMIFLVEELAR